ncbi:MAG: hypothetical protein KJN64_06745 [Ignavibacteria bacterium]|nr:hypothetical protein [Ignavibacteria bacterium]MBT8392642.1 hypothetical protein [Ignavibacteria bacterium]NNL22096.1 hypothetical protein [Ignavibacteriaceae bacterium]
MKSFYLICFATLLFFAGCDNGSELLTNVQDAQLEKPNWISLPDIGGMHIENSFTVTKRINGTQGGSLTMNESYAGGPFGNVTIDAELIFERGAFPGNKYISMTNDDLECTVTLEPSFDKFNDLVTYSVTYTGIDLTNIDPNNVKFAYIASNNALKYAQYDELNVDLSNGTIQVINALIPHFSRYGFVN